MAHDLHLLAQRLAQHVEAVCAHYLSNGRKNGRYWIVGDVQNTPGRSMWVRLTGPLSGPGAAGKFTDSATGDHGDLLDLIRLNLGLTDMRAVREEALTFLSEPRHLARPSLQPVPRNSQAAALRLFNAAKPIRGTLAEVYLREARGITCALDLPALRFHPGCYYRGNDSAELQRLPAMLAAATNLDGDLTGVLRTYLAADGSGKASIAEPRLAMGNILGSAVRFGTVSDVLIAGEGIETTLALRSLLPDMAMVAGLSAGHLGAMQLPRTLRRLYIAMEPNLAGRSAAEILTLRAFSAGVETAFLISARDDWNSDLLMDGADAALARLIPKLAPEDARTLVGSGRDGVEDAGPSAEGAGHLVRSAGTDTLRP